MQGSSQAGNSGEESAEFAVDDASSGYGPAPVALGYLRSLRILYRSCFLRVLRSPHPIPGRRGSGQRVQQDANRLYSVCFLFRPPICRFFFYIIEAKSGFSGRRNGNPCDYMKLAIAGRSRSYQGAVLV
jgi:hypothetical protein